MTGGLGADTFAFQLGASAMDTITDFDSTASSDKLDLKDLLTGESATAASLDAYLDFSYDAGTSTTTVQIKANGTGTGDHQIKLEGFNSTTYSGVGSTDFDILTKMLADSKLIVGP